MQGGKSMSETDCSRQNDRRAELEDVTGEIVKILSAHKITYKEWFSIFDDAKKKLSF